MSHKIITGVVVLSVLLSTLLFPFLYAEAAVPVDLAGIDPGPILELIRAFAAAMGYTDISTNTLNQDVDDLKQLITFFNTCTPPIPTLPPLFEQNCLRQIVELLTGEDPIYQYNLFNTFFTRQQDFIKTFELQRIEKAREDVNKLIFEVETELVDQGTIIRQDDPVTGAPYVIKKPGRIVHNVDDLIYEEPIQKARDYTYCYFGGDLSDTDALDGSPWIIFPFGASDAQSIVIQRKIRDRVLASIQRGAKHRVTAPPETWYTQSLCTQILASFPVRSECFDSPSGCATIGDVENLPTLDRSLERIKAGRSYFTMDEFLEHATNPNNTPEGVYLLVLRRVESIIAEFRNLRQLEYLAGQGVRSEKVLIGKEDPGSAGSGTGNFYFFDTEYVISPAIVLLQKMQAAAQSQFDLAQNAYVDLPSSTDSDTLTAYNLRLGADIPITDSRGETVVTAPGWLKPNPALDTLKFRTTTDPSLATTLTGLPAPWEDTSRYNLLQLTEEGKVKSYNPRRYMVPPDSVRISGSNPLTYMGNINRDAPPPLRDDPHLQRALFPSYRWFIDVTEMYEFASRYGIKNFRDGISASVGWNFLIQKWFGRELEGAGGIDWNTLFF